MYGANCTTRCFHKSTPPQPSTILLQKKSRNSAMTKQCWREKERERERERKGEWEGYVQYYSFKKGSGQPLDNCDREKVNRGWQWHQERNGKIALTRSLIAVHVYVKTLWLSPAMKQLKIARVWKFWEWKRRGKIIAFNAGKTPFPSSRGSVIWCRNYGVKKKPSEKSLSSV